MNYIFNKTASIGGNKAPIERALRALKYKQITIWKIFVRIQFDQFFCEQGKCNENTGHDVDQPIGEIDDYSRHGTTVRLSPEHTKLNSPESPTKETRMEEEVSPSDATAFMLESRVIA